ncbi:thioredoxin, partial [Staphylococcus condimenti]
MSTSTEEWTDITQNFDKDKQLIFG